MEISCACIFGPVTFSFLECQATSQTLLQVGGTLLEPFWDVEPLCMPTAVVGCRRCAQRFLLHQQDEVLVSCADDLHVSGRQGSLPRFWSQE